MAEKKDASGRMVLVGTYKGDQLKDWPGWYCWPLDSDVSATKDTKNTKGTKANDHRGTEALSPKATASGNQTVQRSNGSTEESGAAAFLALRALQDGTPLPPQKRAAGGVAMFVFRRELKETQND